MKPLTPIFLFVVAAVLVVMPQEGETSLSFCRPSPKLVASTSADPNDDDDSSRDDSSSDDSTRDDSSSDDSSRDDSSSDDSSRSGSSKSTSSVKSVTTNPPSRRCENGPARKIFTANNEFYWPPIYRGVCAGLLCDDPPCFARKQVWRTRCVLVYRLINGWWKKIGFRTRRFLEDLECGCKKCEDIRNRTTCIDTKPCPNSPHRDSFCYWKTSPAPRCSCCKPTSCPGPRIFSRTSCSCVCPPPNCPRGRIFNPHTCGCDCPRGTRDINGKCVGDCDDISVGICRTVFCEDNPQLNCAVRNNKCVCPSCDASESASSCVQTKCLEQRGRPTCVYDRAARKCRCPRCSDITKRDRCVSTRPCPESQNNAKTFCFWRPSSTKGGNAECDCCTPRSCPRPRVFDRSSCSCICPNTQCPSGRIFNPDRCSCDCPRGTREVGDDCVGDCGDQSTGICPFINCDDNPSFKCKVETVNRKDTCVCPSCDAAEDRSSCVQTNCLEQRSKPRCVYDSYAKKCRCPECSDQRDKKWCLLTYCGPYNNRQCKYDSQRRKCLCPH